MELGQILDRMFRIYGGNFALLFGIVALSYVPIYVLQIPLFGVYYIKGLGDQAQVIAVICQVVLSLLAILLAYPLAQGAATFAVSERYLGHEVTIGAAYRAAFQRLGKLITTQLTVSLKVGIGFLLLIIPGVLWLLSYFVAIPVVMVEGTGALQTMRRSKDLAYGHRRNIFVIVFMMMVLSWAIAVASYVITLMFWNLTTFTGQVMNQVISGILNLLLAPVWVVAAILFYYDLRIRKEGFDLEMLGKSLAEGQQNSASHMPSQHELGDAG